MRIRIQIQIQSNNSNNIMSSITKFRKVKSRTRLVLLFACTSTISLYYSIVFVNLLRSGSLSPSTSKDYNYNKSYSHVEKKVHTTGNVVLKSKEEINNKDIRPRIINLDGVSSYHPATNDSSENNNIHQDDYYNEMVHTKTKDDWNMNETNNQEYTTLPTGNYDSDRNENCSIQLDWQSTFNPVCNRMHELDMINRINEKDLAWRHRGGVRDIWVLNQLIDGVVTEIVVKTMRLDPKFKKKINEKMYSFQQIDAVASDQLTFSPYYLNIYAHCGFSAMYEYAGNNCESLQNVDLKAIEPLEKLQYASDIAHAMEDLQYGKEEQASIVHRDLGPSNVLIMDGVAKISDFNQGYILKWDRETGVPCPFSDYECGTDGRRTDIRSPEECLGDGNPITDKIDIYGMGTLFYWLLTKNRAYHINKDETDKTSLVYQNYKNNKKHKIIDNERYRQKVISSTIIPILPPEIEIDTNKAISTIRSLMRETMSFNPLNRPNASEVVLRLDQVLLEYESLI